MCLEEIMALPVEEIAAPVAHLYLWCPNALLPEGLLVMKAWGFAYKSNIVWHKIRKDGGSDGRGVGFLFSQCDRTNFVWITGHARTHAGSGTEQNKYVGVPQTGTFAQTGRAVLSH